MDHKYSLVTAEGRSHLDIAEVTEGDYGTYICHVMNVRGQVGFPIVLAKRGNILQDKWNLLLNFIELLWNVWSF